ncbi:MAG: NADPH-dependent FMN reductase [Trueperaceae bacterium]
MEEALSLLGISGSLRKTSSNTTLLKAAQQLTPTGTKLSLYANLASLPHFNPDVEETALPTSIGEFRQHINKADGLVISTPEYAHGVPGSLKNALDWLVGGAEFIGKPVLLLNASSRSSYAQASLIETLQTMSGYIVKEACVTVELMGKNLSEVEIIEKIDLKESIGKGLALFVHNIKQQRLANQT